MASNSHINALLDNDETLLDFHVAQQGALYVVTPLTSVAIDWVDNNIDPYAMEWANGYVVEPSHIGPILRAMAVDGMDVNL